MDSPDPERQSFPDKEPVHLSPEGSVPSVDSFVTAAVKSCPLQTTVPNSRRGTLIGHPIALSGIGSEPSLWAFSPPDAGIKRGPPMHQHVMGERLDSTSPDARRNGTKSTRKASDEFLSDFRSRTSDNTTFLGQYGAIGSSVPSRRLSLLSSESGKAVGGLVGDPGCPSHSKDSYLTPPPWTRSLKSGNEREQEKKLHRLEERLAAVEMTATMLKIEADSLRKGISGLGEAFQRRVENLERSFSANATNVHNLVTNAASCSDHSRSFGGSENMSNETLHDPSLSYEAKFEPASIRLAMLNPKSGGQQKQEQDISPASVMVGSLGSQSTSELAGSQSLQSSSLCASDQASINSLSMPDLKTLNAQGDSRTGRKSDSVESIGFPSRRASASQSGGPTQVPPKPALYSMALTPRGVPSLKSTPPAKSGIMMQASNNLLSLNSSASVSPGSDFSKQHQDALEAFERFKSHSRKMEKKLKSRLDERERSLKQVTTQLRRAEERLADNHVKGHISSDWDRAMPIPATNINNSHTSWSSSNLKTASGWGK